MSRRLMPAALLLALLALGGATTAAGNVVDYVRKPDSAFMWSKQSENGTGNGRVVLLKMRSQVWRGIPWEHQVQVFLPPKIRHPRTAMLMITGGNPGTSEAILGTTVAARLEAPFVILYNIPNQPLFEGKYEDDLIAHTFQEYLQSGDETWPLLFPMTRSAVRAMDAVQELSKKEWDEPVRDFVVTGASKRGWTTWLAAASDSRVRAIAPMVFDNLRFERQMPRQLALWGRYSEQIEDYTRRGLQQQMSTERGKKLVSMVDPWFLRKQLAVPKLLVNGANDRYWATDATRIYWDDLIGDKHLLSVPNSGHGLEDKTRVLNTVTAFFHAVAAGKEFPRLTEVCRNGGGKVTLRVSPSARPLGVRLWTSVAPDLDFRPVRWQSIPMRPDGDAWVGEVDAPAAGGLALFAEAEFETEGRKFTLSTPASIFRAGGPEK